MHIDTRAVSLQGLPSIIFKLKTKFIASVKCIVYVRQWRCICVYGVLRFNVAAVNFIYSELPANIPSYSL